MSTPADRNTMIADPESIRRAMLEGALHKANDAVHADNIRDFRYALTAYQDSVAMLSRVMERSEQGGEQWRCMDSIRAVYVQRIYEIRETQGLMPKPLLPKPRSPRSKTP